MNVYAEWFVSSIKDERLNRMARTTTETGVVNGLAISVF